jgi:hypothetical protein
VNGKSHARAISATRIVAQISLMQQNRTSGLEIGPETPVPLCEGERAQLISAALVQSQELIWKRRFDAMTL